MMLSSLLTLLSTLGATALIFVSLLGGYDSSILPNTYMFNLDASKLANTELDNNTGNGCDCIQFVNGTITVNGNANQNIANTTNATYLAIGEYYAVFTINYCEGQYLANSGDKDVSSILTNCKTPSLSRRFNFEHIVEDALVDLGISIDDIDWPDGVTNAFLYYHSAGTAIIAFFIAGVAFSLVTSFVAILALCTAGRTVFMALLIFSTLTLVSLAIAAGVTTASITSVVNGINSSSDDLDLSASQGNLFLGLIWSAVALCFIASLITATQLCMPGGNDGFSSSRGRRNRYGDLKGPYNMMPMPRYPSDYYNHQDPYSSTRALRGAGPEWEEEDDFR